MCCSTIGGNSLRNEVGGDPLWKHFGAERNECDHGPSKVHRPLKAAPMLFRLFLPGVSACGAIREGPESRSPNLGSSLRRSGDWKNFTSSRLRDNMANSTLLR
jgi:hypothetical protein